MTSPELNESKSILEHVGELRRKLLIALGVFVVGAVISHIFHEEIIKFLLMPAGGRPLIFLSPLEPLFFIFKIDAIGGLIIAFPIIMWCIFSYISPALSKKANNLVFFFYASSTFLLFTSLIYAFFVTIPISLKFLLSINIPGIENNFSVEKYFSFFMTQAFIIMVVFQIPVLMVGAVSLGLIKTSFLANKRRLIYFFLLVALAVITPTSDVFSLAIIFVPCLAIFEISLIGGKIVESRKKKKKQQELLISEYSE
ncbi:MAG TPA: twin-arginine translocase subunit TatC [Candidatus Paceibacterota bacterium]|nr:twin-arginine translocase subunit TatC [Candidatus Paceibacterota bacterium]